VPPPLVRGTLLVVVSDSDGKTYTLEVSGPGVNPGQYYAKTTLVGTKVITGTVDVRRPPTPNAEYLELSPGSLLPTVTTTTKTLLGTSYLAVTDTTTFPANGRCRVTLLDGPAGSPGTTVEMSYSGKATYELRNVRWGSSPSLESEIYGAHGSEVAAGCVITLIGRYADSLINPAFAALVKARAKHPGSATSVLVTADNAKQLYDLLKNTSTIVETTVMTHPAPMLDAIAEATPVGSTTVIFSKQVFSDTLDVTPSDSQAMFQTPSVQITVADPAVAPVTPGNIPTIWLPPNLMSLGLGSTLDLGAGTNPNQLQGPFEYQWSVVDQINAAVPATTSSLDGPTLRIDLGDPQSLLYVKLTVRHPVTGASCTSVVYVRRFNIPGITVQVTSPTNGTPLAGGDWNVPSPNPVISLQALVDPAVAPVGIAPYTYSWAVVNEQAPYAAPSIAGGTTATPTLSSVASNAVLKVTLTLVASGIDGSLTNTFQKVFRVRLV